MQQVNTPWNIRSDGVFLTEPPQQLFLKGHIANIPIVIGACTLVYPKFVLKLTTNITAGNDEDEGSAFAFPSLNVT